MKEELKKCRHPERGTSEVNSCGTAVDYFTRLCLVRNDTLVFLSQRVQRVF